MRDIASLQIPSPPKTTCEEIPKGTQAPIQVAPGKWSKSNQRKRLILALKRNKNQDQPREHVTATSSHLLDKRLNCQVVSYLLGKRVNYRPISVRCWYALAKVLQQAVFGHGLCVRV